MKSDKEKGYSFKDESINFEEFGIKEEKFIEIFKSSPIYTLD